MEPVVTELIDWQSAAEEAEEALGERLAGWGAKYQASATTRLPVSRWSGREHAHEVTQAPLPFRPARDRPPGSPIRAASCLILRAGGKTLESCKERGVRCKP